MTLTTCIDAAEIMLAKYCIISASQLKCQSCHQQLGWNLPDSPSKFSSGTEVPFCKGSTSCTDFGGYLSKHVRTDYNV